MDETREGTAEATFEYRVFVDTDRDGLSDGREELVWGSDPDKADTDGDGLHDGDEVQTHRTDPTRTDTDGDGFDDRFEIITGFDPLEPTRTPDTVSSIREAAEFRFSAANGVSYRIETSSKVMVPRPRNLDGIQL